MQLDLTDEEATALLSLLNRAIDDDRYPLAMRCVARRSGALPAVPVHHRKARQQIPRSGRRIPIEPAPPLLAVHQEVGADQERNTGYFLDRLRGEFLGSTVGWWSRACRGPSINC
jgi:hypothetical protein